MSLRQTYIMRSVRSYEIFYNPSCKKWQNKNCHFTERQL